MNRNQAEEIVMAAELGLFHGTKAELVEATLIMTKSWNDEEEGQGQSK